MPITENDVVNAYRLLLGREPENRAVVEAQVRRFTTLDELRTAFAASEEFSGFLADMRPVQPAPEAAIAVGRFSTAPRIEVQVEGPGHQLRAMFDRVIACWTALGVSEPHWSVLSAPEFMQEKIEHHEGDFYASGVDQLNQIEAVFARTGRSRAGIRTVVELGCGLARVTAALARAFPHVIGLDVSANHLALARRHLERIGCSNAELKRLTSLTDLGVAQGYDLFVSFIVLQHNPPPVIATMLRLAFAGLRGGGYAYFQVPTYRSGYRFVWDDYLADRNEEMEMHVLPQEEVFAAMRRSGMQLIDVQEDAWVGEAGFVSHTFFAQKL